MRWWVEKIYRTGILKKQGIMIPGRWIVKKDTEKWMMNYHPDPGYTNNLKKEWVENLKNQKDQIH